METLADYDIIWKDFACKANLEMRRNHLNQVIRAQEENSKNRWLSKESREHCRKVVKLAKNGMGIATIKRFESGRFWLNMKQYVLICEVLGIE